jgi:ferredoxin-NADP reductase
MLVKARGRDTNLLQEVQLPSLVKLNGPFGVSFWHSHEPQLWVAYGVGIAIFLGAARSMPDSFTAQVHLAYCEKTPDRIVFGGEFDALSTRRQNFSWNQFYGEGPKVLVELEKNMEQWSKRFRIFRICGHPGFQKAARDLLLLHGVPKQAILLEGIF